MNFRLEHLQRWAQVFRQSEASNAALKFPRRVSCRETFSRCVTASGVDFMSRTAKELYVEYLQSDHWRGLRLKAFQKYGRRCSKCPATCRLEVHHKIYRWPWESALVEDLQILCRDCHQAEHGIGVPVQITRDERRHAQKRKRKKHGKRQFYDLYFMLNNAKVGNQISMAQKHYASRMLRHGNREQRQIANQILQAMANRSRRVVQWRTGNFIKTNGRLIYNP